MTPEQSERRANWLRGVAARLPRREMARALSQCADAMTGRAAMQRYRLLASKRRPAAVSAVQDDRPTRLSLLT